MTTKLSKPSRKRRPFRVLRVTQYYHRVYTQWVKVVIRYEGPPIYSLYHCSVASLRRWIRAGGEVSYALSSRAGTKLIMRIEGELKDTL